MTALAKFLDHHDITRRKTASRRVAVVLVLIVATIIAGAYLLRRDMRNTQWHAAEETAQNLALGLERDIARVFDTNDLSLQDAINALALPGFDSLPSRTQYAALYNGFARTALSGLTVVDKNGLPNFTSDGGRYGRADYSDRPWFQVHRDRSDIGLFVSPPILGQVSNVRHVALSRRVSAADGSFAGVVCVRIPTEYFAKLFAAMKLDPQSVVTLVTMSGLIVHRSPFDEADFGRNVSSAPVFKLIEESRSGMYQATSLVDNTLRLYAYRQVGSLPFVLVVGLSEKSIFAPWKRTATMIAGVLTMMAVLAAGLGATLWRELNRRDDAERAAHDKSVQLLRAGSLLRTIMETESSLIYARDNEGRMLLANGPLLKFLGKTWSEIENKTVAEFFDDPLQAESVATSDREIIAAGKTRAVEEFLGKNGGNPRLWLSTKTPMRDETGKISGIVGISIDITERKRAEDKLRLMVNELNHRVKNTLATVQAIVSQTLRGTAPATREALEGRLLALSAAHDVLTRENWQSAELEDIVTAALTPFGGSGSDCFKVSGPPMRLWPRAALALALGLHELATNALKYGALSNGSGQVTIHWEIVPGSKTAVRLTWTERGGPPVKIPTQRGFGTKLLEGILAQDLGGTTRISFDDPRGLVGVIEAPLEEVAALAELVPFPVVGGTKGGRN
ncbi:MAG: HWE histidine kinase domain-containing protein [Allorhizobium sp.]